MLCHTRSMDPGYEDRVVNKSACKGKLPGKMLQWGGKNKNDLVAECRSTTKIKTVITRASYGIHNCHAAADNML